MKTDNIKASLTRDIRMCSWIDCLGRQVKIRDIGISELEYIIRKNLERFARITTPTDEDIFGKHMNYNIKEMIRIYELADH